METNVNVQNNDEVEIDLREILFVDKIIYHTKVSVRNVNLCYE